MFFFLGIYASYICWPLLLKISLLNVQKVISHFHLLSLGTPKTTQFLEMVVKILFPYIWGNIYIFFKGVCVKLAFLSTYLKVCLSCSLTPLTDGIRLLLCAIVLIQHVPFSIIIIPCMIVSMRNFSSSSCQVHGF